MTLRKQDQTPYELTEDGRRTMYDVVPKGTIVSGEEVREYGWKDITKKVSAAKSVNSTDTAASTKDK